MRTSPGMAWVWATLLVLCIVSNLAAQKIIPSPDRSNSLGAVQWIPPGSIPKVAVSTDWSTLWQEFFPLHVGDTWVYGYTCADYVHGVNKQEGTLTRVITHIDTIGGQAYSMIQDTYQETDGTSISSELPVVHSNYRMDTQGNVYAYEPRLGIELLVFKLSAQPWPENSDRWLEYEGELPEHYLAQLGLWWKEDSGAHGYQPKYDYMVFFASDPLGSMSYGGAVLRREIGIITVYQGGDLLEVECRLNLLRAVIAGREYESGIWKDTVVEETTWGKLKSSFLKP